MHRQIQQREAGVSDGGRQTDTKVLADRDHRSVRKVQTEARSAKAPGRAVFSAMLDEVETGAIQGIITWNSDRLSRNSVDTGRLIYLFDQGKLQEVVTPTQVFRNTPTDKFMLTLFCTQAKLDNDTKGVNVKRGLKAKAERGMYPAPAPIGYTNDYFGQKGLKSVKLNPNHAPLMRRIFDTMLTGAYTVPALHRLVTKDWGLPTLLGKKLPLSTLYYILNNPFYAGSFEYPLKSGNWYRGNHEPIISLEEYDRIQALMGRKGRPRPRSHVFDFTGILTCGECGGTITAEEKIKRPKNGKVHRYVYYRCTKNPARTCSQPYLEERSLKAQALGIIEQFSLPPEFHSFAMKWFRKEHGKELASRTTVLRQQRVALDATVTKIDGLTDMRAMREITEEEFTRRRSSLLQEKLRLEELLGDTGRRPEQWLDAAERLLAFADDAKAKFLKGIGPERRRILVELGSNLCVKDRKLVVEPQKTFAALKAATTAARDIYDSIEPPENSQGKTKIEQAYAQFPMVLRALNDMRTTLMGLSSPR